MDEATYIERYLTSWIPHTLTFLSRCVCFFVLQFSSKVLVDANGMPTPACDGIMVPGRKKKCFRCAKGRHACERVVDPEHLPSLASKRQESIYGTLAKNLLERRQAVKRAGNVKLPTKGT